jgi:hypothetical protein
MPPGGFGSTVGTENHWNRHKLTYPRFVSMELLKLMMRSLSLAPSNSPLTTSFLGQYVSSLMQETITYLELSYSALALKMFVPEKVLRDAVGAKMALTRGQWGRLAKLPGLSTTFELRPVEQDAAFLLGSLFSARFLIAGNTEDRALSPVVAE